MWPCGMNPWLIRVLAKYFKENCSEIYSESQVKQEWDTNGMKGFVTKRGPDLPFVLSEPFPETVFLKIYK